MAAVRARMSLDEAEGWLPPAGLPFLRSGAEMVRLFADWPAAVPTAAEIGADCAFDLLAIAPKLPPCDVPHGHTEISWLRHLTEIGAGRRYGPSARNPDAYRQIAYELHVIEELGFAGYFLIVHDITEFCHDSGILCQGRGSAANSAVCYAIGITNVDPVGNGLLFERFLSPERDGPPDIDVDIEAGRREEAIQHVYTKYGRERAAQVANVITYRPRSAVRDAARALGYAVGDQDAWSKRITPGDRMATDKEIPTPVRELAAEFADLPRHLGIHSCGMVICDRPIGDVCPTEWARMENRSVVQWDKDDCAEMGLVKFDLLGLGMLTALHHMIDLAREHYQVDIDLAHIDLTDPGVYAMLARADSVGVFQVESRAQMATLPRLQPSVFFDLVVEVALIRPGPIQGGSVHPYIRRRNGREPVTYDHPALESALANTLGIPLFQEQLMQMAIDIAGFTAAEADQLRRAMGSKRSEARMEKLRDRFYTGMRDRHGITGDTADKIYRKIKSFANFGFPLSHSFSFAGLVFYSAWFKYHYPAVFTAALLRSQPMGFYSPQSLVADARRHGVEVLGPDINHSSASAQLADRGTRIRIGLDSIHHLGDGLAERIVAERDAHGPYISLGDLTRRLDLTATNTESIATAGAFGSFGLTRREALWHAGPAAAQRSEHLDGVLPSTTPALPGMTTFELVAADAWATGITTTAHPLQLLREHLQKLSVVPADQLGARSDGERVLVAGAVTHRQRPGTAGGVTFLSLEDETGLINIIVSQGLWQRQRKLANTALAMIVRGQLQIADGSINLVADQLRPLDLPARIRSRDFH